METKQKNLSLHSSKSHKAYLVNQDQDQDQDQDQFSLAENSLDLEMHEFPIESKDELFLFDLEKKEIIETFKTLESVSLYKYSPETLALKDILLNIDSKLKIPKSVEKLYIDGGNYMSTMMSKGYESLKLWDEFTYNIQTWKFISTLGERLKIESDFRSHVKEIETLNLTSPINSLLKEIIDTNISELAIRWVYLSEKDFDIIHKFKSIETLDLSYIYNDRLNKVKLPPNLIFLKIYGTTIESLSEINLKGLKLETLDLEGNTIKDLSSISILPNTIVDLCLKENHIKRFAIEDLPKSLEYLSLENNLIENTFFEGINEKAINSTIKYLSLSNNLLKVNNWLLYRITQTFPMLEYIDLLGNEICDIPEDLLINNDDSSSMVKINYWMELQDYQHIGSYMDLKDTFNYYDESNNIILKWKHKLLPSKIILSDIQLKFNDYLGKMPKFNLFREGLYCDIKHDEISIVIREETEPENSIVLELYAANIEIFKTYYYKYFSEVNRLVKLNTHHHVLPVVSFSGKSEIYEKFFKFVFHIDKKIRNNAILISNNGAPLLLVNNNNDRDDLYKEINRVAFVIITGKSACCYVIDDNYLISNIDLKYIKYKYLYNLTLRTSEEKQDYVNSITNKYLGNNCFEEAVIYAGQDVTQKITIYYNPNYFYENSNNIVCKTSKIAMNEQLLVAPEIGYNLLNVSINESKIFLKYRANPDKPKPIKKTDKTK
jgi:hypothetical protein